MDDFQETATRDFLWEDEKIGGNVKKYLRYAVLFTIGLVLIVCITSVMIRNDTSGIVPGQYAEDLQGNWNEETVLISLSSLIEEEKHLKNRQIWSPQTIAAVKSMFKENPSLLQQWIKLSGKKGNVYLAKVTPKEHVHHFSDLDKDMQILDASISQLSPDPSQDAGADTKWLPHVNSRAAFLMVNDLSKDWDQHTNYSSTPWEFCAGRELSTRQVSNGILWMLCFARSQIFFPMISAGSGDPSYSAAERRKHIFSRARARVRAHCRSASARSTSSRRRGSRRTATWSSTRRRGAGPSAPRVSDLSHEQKKYGKLQQ